MLSWIWIKQYVLLHFVK